MDSQSPPTHGDAQLTAIGTEAVAHPIPNPSLASLTLEERITRNEEVTQRHLAEFTNSMRMVASALLRLSSTHTGIAGAGVAGESGVAGYPGFAGAGVAGDNDPAATAAGVSAPINGAHQPTISGGPGTPAASALSPPAPTLTGVDALASSPSDRAPQVWQLPIALAGEPPQTVEEGGSATINAGGSLSLNLSGPASLEATRTLEATRESYAASYAAAAASTHGGGARIMITSGPNPPHGKPPHLHVCTVPGGSPPPDSTYQRWLYKFLYDWILYTSAALNAQPAGGWDVFFWTNLMTAPENRAGYEQLLRFVGAIGTTPYTTVRALLTKRGPLTRDNATQAKTLLEQYAEQVHNPTNVQ